MQTSTGPAEPLADRLSRSPWRAAMFLAPWWVRGLPAAVALGLYIAVVLRIGGLAAVASWRATLPWAAVLGVVLGAVVGVLIARQDARLRGTAPPMDREVWQRRADVAWRGTPTEDPDLRAWARWLVEQDVIRLHRNSPWNPFWWTFWTLGFPLVVVVLVLALAWWSGSGLPALTGVVLLVVSLSNYTFERRMRHRRAALLDPAPT